MRGNTMSRDAPSAPPKDRRRLLIAVAALPACWLLQLGLYMAIRHGVGIHPVAAKVIGVAATPPILALADWMLRIRPEWLNYLVLATILLLSFANVFLGPSAVEGILRRASI